MTNRIPTSCGALLLFSVSLAIFSEPSAQGIQPTMGFTRQFNFPYASVTNLHWISIPWKYLPQDTGTIGVLDAEDLCADLGGSQTIAAVLRWNEATSSLVEHPCGAASPFALAEGTGYALRNAAGSGIAGALAGAHDNAFSYSIAATGGSQLSWLSVPYHLRIPEKFGDLLVNAEDLCRQIGSSELLAITRWNNDQSAYEAYGCGSTFVAPFEINRGESYGVVNRATQTIVWQPIHY